VTAVQQTLGQLDMMLAGQGLSLGQAHVGQQGAGQRGGAPSRSDGSGETDAVADVAAPSIVRATALGLLDTFA
jgi:flagellar hook-length control protein FliK